MKSLSVLIRAVLTSALLYFTPVAWCAPADFADIEAQVAMQHDDGVKRLQE